MKDAGKAMQWSNVGKRKNRVDVDFKEFEKLCGVVYRIFFVFIIFVGLFFVAGCSFLVVNLGFGVGVRVVITVGILLSGLFYYFIFFLRRIEELVVAFFEEMVEQYKDDSVFQDMVIGLIEEQQEELIELYGFFKKIRMTERSAQCQSISVQLKALEDPVERLCHLNRVKGVIHEMRQERIEKEEEKIRSGLELKEKELNLRELCESNRLGEEKERLNLEKDRVFNELSRKRKNLDEDLPNEKIDQFNVAYGLFERKKENKMLEEKEE